MCNTRVRDPSLPEVNHPNYRRGNPDSRHNNPLEHNHPSPVHSQYPLEATNRSSCAVGPLRNRTTGSLQGQTPGDHCPNPPRRNPPNDPYLLDLLLGVQHLLLEDEGLRPETLCLLLLPMEVLRERVH